MAITKLVFHNGRKKGLIKVEDDTFYKGRGKYKGIFRKRKLKWYQKDIIGTKEELEEAWKVAEEYLYKILEYAEKDELIPEDKLDEARRIFAFVRQGPRAHHFVVQQDTKLTSADVLYFLSCNVPATLIADRYGISPVELRNIRNGTNPVWEWEYRFVKRLKAIIKNKLRERDITTTPVVYRLSRVLSPTSKEDILFATSYNKAKKMRLDIITKKELNELTKAGTLDVVYPIEAIQLV